MDQLPTEILALIFSHIDPLSIWTLRRVSKPWQGFLSSTTLVNQVLVDANLTPDASGLKAFRAHYEGIPLAYRCMGVLDTTIINTSRLRHKCGLHGSTFVIYFEDSLSTTKELHVFDVESGDHYCLSLDWQSSAYEILVTEHIAVVLAEDELGIVELRTRKSTVLSLPILPKHHPGWYYQLSCYKTKVALLGQYGVWLYDHANGQISTVDIRAQPEGLIMPPKGGFWPSDIHLKSDTFTVFTTYQNSELKSLYLHSKEFSMDGTLLRESTTNLPFVTPRRGIGPWVAQFRTELVRSEDSNACHLTIKYDTRAFLETDVHDTPSIHLLGPDDLSHFAGDVQASIWRETAYLASAQGVQFHRKRRGKYWTHMKSLAVSGSVKCLIVNSRYLVMLTEHTRDLSIRCFSFAPADSSHWVRNPFELKGPRNDHLTMTEAAMASSGNCLVTAALYRS